MKYTAILSKTTTDQVKSKIPSPQLVMLTLDVYMKPEEYARLITEYFEREMTIEIT